MSQQAELFRSLLKKDPVVVERRAKVKIVSSWTNPGGGTVAHINLTNLLNANGFDCTFYGPHEWHLDKCKSEKLDKCLLGPTDILISHFIQVPEEVNVKRHILYCHEKDIWPLKNISLARYDDIVFVSNSQKEWQDIDRESVIIPPVVNKINWTDPKNNVAGVIGSVDKNKQTHKSIQRALADGYEKVVLFGQINDTPYFYEKVRPLLATGRVVLADHEDDSEAMYGQISEVYHSSLSETYGLVEAECRLAGIPFNGKPNGIEVFDDAEILERWKVILK
mgnify:CR=1 FL=1